MKKIIFLIMTITLIGMMSCSDYYAEDITDDSVHSVESVLEQAKNKILSMGLDTTDMMELGNYYVVENDILINKDSLDSFNLTRQYRTSIYVNNRMTISVGVDNTITESSGWIEAIKEVINIYNEHTGLNFYYSSSPNILISKKAVGNNYTCAQGEFPTSSSYPGKNVYINTRFYSNIDTYLTHKQKVFLLMHEIGHNLGLRHTNCAVNGEGTSGAVKISGTPDTDIDSYMNSNTCNHIWLSMPYYDDIALKSLWPKPVMCTLTLDGVGEQEFEQGTTPYIPDPPVPEGKTTFKGWFYDKELTRPYNKEHLYDDTVLYPKWVVRIYAGHYSGTSSVSTSFVINTPTMVTFRSVLCSGLNDWSDVLSYNKVCANLVYPSSSPIECEVYTQDYNEEVSSCNKAFEKKIMLNRLGTYIITAHFPIPEDQGANVYCKHGSVETTVEY